MNGLHRSFQSRVSRQEDGHAPRIVLTDRVNWPALVPSVGTYAKSHTRVIPREIVHHMTKDELVGWGWHPGEGRNAIPIPHEEFAKYVNEWAAKGGACPK